MKRVRTLRRATLASAFLCVLSALIFGASCRSAVGLTDGYEDSVDGLCELLKRCPVDVGECTQYIRPKLPALGDAMWEIWISHLGEHECFDGCRAARGCLDLAPLCSTGACSVKEECCGFATGRAECDVADGRCCMPAGVGCTKDSDCCEGSGPCSLMFGTCGGVTCKQIGDPCVNSFECCTKACVGRVCSPNLCGDAGFDCDIDKDCCAGLSCQPGAGPDGRGQCAKPTCSLLGSPCSKASDCCAVPGGAQCYVPPDLPPGEVTGFCSTCDHGLPNDVDCGANSQCCSGYCDKNFFLCGEPCLKQGSACSQSAECCDGTCENGACNVACPSSCVNDSDCCTNKCIGGICKPQCAVVDECLHGVCFAGAPLSKGCSTCTGPGCPINKTCVDEVCKADPYCCCTSWDSLCVAHVFDNPGACPNPCGP